MKSESTLIIRADASKSIGAGHVLRCLALAQVWQVSYGPVIFACAELTDSISGRLRVDRMTIARIKADVGSNADAQELMGLNETHRACCIVIDGYRFGHEYCRQFSCFAGASLTIDDCADQPRYTTDLVLNQNPGVSEDRYLGRADDSELLLGTDYALLRREFTARSPRINYASSPVRVLVTLGGGDSGNILETVIAGLSEIESHSIEVRVLGGVGLVVEDERFQFISFCDNPADHFEWADLAVVAGGSTNWELCYFGVPRVLIVLAENQRVVANELSAVDVAAIIDEPAKMTPVIVHDSVRSWITDGARFRAAQKKARQLVDGRGATRVAKRLHQLATGAKRSKANVGER